MIKALSILTTYHCNAKCSFCECGPSFRVKLSRDDLISYIDEADSLGTVGQVVFTGGEPTLLGQSLFDAISHANSLGLLTRVVTNGWWGVNSQRAVSFVGQLQNAGLTEINISIDDLHQQWIPLEHVKYAFHGCLSSKLKCLIAHKAFKKARITKKYLEDFFGVELVDYKEDTEYSPDEELRLFSSGTIVPIGRKPKKPVEEDDLLYGSYVENCSSILRDIVLDPYHNLLACCGIVTKNLPELTLGNLRQQRMIDIISEANKDVILNWLVLEGPAAIAEFVKAINPSICFARRYVSKCHLCNEILTREDVRRVLHEHIHEVINRVSLHRDFLETVRSNEELMKIYCC